MITEYDNEPIPGLPGLLPKDERILWQGSPDWRVLARTAFHTRLTAGYFAVLALAALASGGTLGAAATVGVGLVGVALLHVLAWASARATIYTLTNRRIVFRIGIALPKCINLPLGVIGAVDATVRSDGSGDLPLHVAGAQRIGYAGLWPHARPWHLAVPQPMLRAIPDAERVGALIARTCLAANPDGAIAPLETPGAAPAYGQAVAA
ncbi:Photosynthetic complex assembly protein [Sphingomonas sp. EC-HK361]|uniref:photosynthetic complex putative assembly protein PuhB n=1 Tax=Sphingomonas sp. EC-HK361 TaxID=2038397 RepID=UPI0012530CA8|nr:photosynthetic complex putative assembly protein PuhB [Sphingomonas sp. EC-HK361]VVS99895.1 Photosynthetic complex assembly protein [Sphingomonas sp. EC-HK361]